MLTFADKDGRYIYIEDLMQLSKYHDPTTPGDPRISVVRTPLIWHAWEQKLRRHPDKDYTNYILKGIKEGFRIGVDEARVFKSAKRNMKSSDENPEVIDKYIGKQTCEGNIFGPFSVSLAPDVHLNRFGTIPKKQGGWRLITDLSYPEGKSINDAIDPELCSLSYVKVEQIARTALTLGKNALLAKIDIKSAFRLVPIHPADRKWLGMQWKDFIYVDGMLPFGLRSAPKLFNSIADALEWCACQEGIEYIFHYLDDFVVLGPPGSLSCLHFLETLKRICSELGVPLSPEKEEGPSPVLTVLGIVIDTIKGELRLPEDKLSRLIQAASEWSKRKKCTRKELESLVGTLQHAATVVRPGRTFFRRAISLLKRRKPGQYYIRLNGKFRADMMWWKTFATHWNGASLLITEGCRTASVTSDASGSWGCGAWYGCKWFQLQWDNYTQSLHIAAKELVPIIVAAAVWGRDWQGCRVTAYCDNSAVVEVLNNRRCQDEVLMQMLRCLFFIEAKGQFYITSKHVPGVHNCRADELSRNQLPAFLASKPDADPFPTLIPLSVLQWLLHPAMEWTSLTWMELFSTFAQTA